MVAIAHLGIGHPDLAWLVVSGVLAFVAGLGVNLYRARREPEPTTDDADPE